MAHSQPACPSDQGRCGKLWLYPGHSARGKAGVSSQDWCVGGRDCGGTGRSAGHLLTLACRETGEQPISSHFHAAGYRKTLANLFTNCIILGASEGTLARGGGRPKQTR